MSIHTAINLPLPLKIKQDLLQFLISQEPNLNREGMAWKIEFDLSKRDLKLARYNLMLLEIFENSKWDSMPPGLKEIQVFRNLINNLQVCKGDANSNNQVQWSNFSEEAIEEALWREQYNLEVIPLLQEKSQDAFVDDYGQVGKLEPDLFEVGEEYTEHPIHMIQRK